LQGGIAVRPYQRTLLVLGLTIGMIAASIAWERFYVSPLVDSAQQKSIPPQSAAEDLPEACLEELSTMGSSTTADSRPAGSSAQAAAALGQLSPSVGDNVLRQGDKSNQAAVRIQVADSAPSSAPAEVGKARPIGPVQSAGYVEPVIPAAVDPWAGQRSSTAAALPASVEQSRAQKDLREIPKSVDVLDLIRRLRADDGDQRADARSELVRRGFSEVDLELARQLFSPDVETRKQLARAVPRLSSVDAAQWLMWLALDPQPEVRLAAVATLATTGDPALLGRVEELARNDRDPQIHALADQIAKQRDLAASRGNPVESAGRVNPLR
jgi:hypothetical protein